MCDGYAQQCPVLNELCALRKFKAKADSRIGELEMEVAHSKIWESELAESRVRINELLARIEQLEQEKTAAYRIFETEKATIIQDMNRSLDSARKRADTMSSDNLKLENEISSLRQELKSWTRVANSAWHAAPTSVEPREEFPHNDSEKQRLAISDLVRQVSIRDVGDRGEHDRLVAKLQQTQHKLKSLKSKWLQMQQEMESLSGEDHFDVNVLRDSDFMNRFGRHVKSLSRVTREIKEEYRQKRSRYS
jgi:hypothetical protein